MLILGDDRGADGRKAWPPTLPPVFAADASWTEPSVNTPAASVTIASFANWFSFFLGIPTHNIFSETVAKKKDNSLKRKLHSQLKEHKYLKNVRLPWRIMVVMRWNRMSAWDSFNRVKNLCLGFVGRWIIKGVGEEGLVRWGYGYGHVCLLLAITNRSIKAESWSMYSYWDVEVVLH